MSGIPSFCAAAARMDISLTEWNESFMSSRRCIRSKKIKAIRDARAHEVRPERWSDVKQMLMQSGSQAVMIENCGMENERIFTRAEDIPEDASYYSLIIVKDPKK